MRRQSINTIDTESQVNRDQTHLFSNKEHLIYPPRTSAFQFVNIVWPPLIDEA